MECIYCGSSHTNKDGNYKGYQRYKCLDCKKTFKGEQYTRNLKYINHFNIKIQEKDTNYLTRENYCIIPDTIDSMDRKSIKTAEEYVKKGIKLPLSLEWCSNIPNEFFKDKEHYTDTFIKEHYNECIENFDLNIKYFNSINHDEFDKYLSNFIKKNNFKEVYDLNLLDKKEGIYILVLDKYNQVYIGISNSIRKRIISHWNNKKEFRRLIFGKVNNSILSIDSFGALDTTRIYYKELNLYSNIYNYEEKYVSSFKKDYRLNRVAGGLNGETDSRLRELEFYSTKQNRKLI